MPDAYPVDYAVERPTSPRNRLTVAFRPILAIPHVLLVGGPVFAAGGAHIGSANGVLSLVAGVAAIINWFAIVFTGKAIAGLMELQEMYLRWRARALAYEALLRDEYPPFGEGNYPATIALPDRMLEGRNRWTVGFRLILVIPHVIVLAVLFVLWIITAVVGWFVVLFTGAYPEGFWTFGEGVLRWSLRVEAYMLLLVDRYPPFTLEPSAPAPASPPPATA